MPRIEPRFFWYERLCGELLRVQGEFERFAQENTGLFHAMFQFDSPLEDSAWEAFVRANHGSVGHGQAENWEPLPDRSLGGCFYGDLNRLGDFRRIAASGLLILRDIEFLSHNRNTLPEDALLRLPDYPENRLDVAWLQLVHQTAQLNTAFLRLETVIWNLPSEISVDDLPDDDRFFASDEKGTRCPAHPICSRLHLDLFSSSSEAINCWMNPEGVVPVGGLFDHSPVELPGVDSATEPEVIDPRMPRWDGWTLSLGEQPARVFRHEAGNQKKILWAFENAGWPSVVEDPFTLRKVEAQEKGKVALNAVLEPLKTSRREAVKELNDGQKLLSFECTGDGYGVSWKLRDTLNENTEHRD